MQLIQFKNERKKEKRKIFEMRTENEFYDIMT